MTKILVVIDYPSKSALQRGGILTSLEETDLTKMLHEAGILYSECKIVSASSVAPQPNFKDASKEILDFFIKYTKGTKVPNLQLEKDIKSLHLKINDFSPDLIIAMGELALWTLTNESSITKWRGSILEIKVEGKPYKLIPTYTPAAISRKFDWRFIVVQDLRRCKREAAFREVRMPAYNFIIRPSFEKVIGVLDGLLNTAQTAPYGTVCHNPGDPALPHGRKLSPVLRDPINRPPLLLSGDIETRGGHITCFGIAWSKTDAICIPLMCVENVNGYWAEAEELAILQRLYLLFTSPSVGWIFQNVLYDAQYFAKWWGFIPRIFMDTMIAQHTCFLGLPKGLDFQSSIYCQFHRYWKDDGKEFHESIKNPADEEKYWVYNCKDCVTTFETAGIHLSNIQAMGQVIPYRFQHSQIFPVLRMMLKGVRTHKANKQALAEELFHAKVSREQWLEEVVGFPLNVRSPKQMQEFFYSDLALPIQKNRKTGRPSLDDKAMETLRKKEPLVVPIIDCISEIRSIGVFLSTFVKAPTSEDGRTRSSYNICGAETLRWSSSTDAFGDGMNLQNIPKGNEV